MKMFTNKYSSKTISIFFIGWILLALPLPLLGQDAPKPEAKGKTDKLLDFKFSYSPKFYPMGSEFSFDLYNFRQQPKSYGDYDFKKSSIIVSPFFETTIIPWDDFDLAIKAGIKITKNLPKNVFFSKIAIENNLPIKHIIKRAMDKSDNENLLRTHNLLFTLGGDFDGVTVTNDFRIGLLKRSFTVTDASFNEQKLFEAFAANIRAGGDASNIGVLDALDFNRETLDASTFAAENKVTVASPLLKNENHYIRAEHSLNLLYTAKATYRYNDKNISTKDSNLTMALESHYYFDLFRRPFGEWVNTLDIYSAIISFDGGRFRMLSGGPLETSYQKSMFDYFATPLSVLRKKKEGDVHTSNDVIFVYGTGYRIYPFFNLSQAKYKYMKGFFIMPSVHVGYGLSMQDKFNTPESRERELERAKLGKPSKNRFNTQYSYGALGSIGYTFPDGNKVTFGVGWNNKEGLVFNVNTFK